MQADQEREVIIRGVGLVDDFEVEGLGHDDTTVVFARVQGIIQDGCREGAEDITAPEMYPSGFLGGLLTYFGDVKLRELVAFGFPLCGIEIPGNYFI